ncbi:MAG TPA: hypothetical protein VGJ59_14565 [Jatrophihabitantaceae bacterium]
MSGEQETLVQRQSQRYHTAAFEDYRSRAEQEERLPHLVIEFARPVVCELERPTVPADTAPVASRTPGPRADAASYQPFAAAAHQLMESFDLTSTQDGMTEVDARPVRHNGSVFRLSHPGCLAGSADNHPSIRSIDCEAEKRDVAGANLR